MIDIEYMVARYFSSTIKKRGCSGEYWFSEVFYDVEKGIGDVDRYLLNKGKKRIKTIDVKITSALTKKEEDAIELYDIIYDPTSFGWSSRLEKINLPPIGSKRKITGKQFNQIKVNNKIDLVPLQDYIIGIILRSNGLSIYTSLNTKCSHLLKIQHYKSLSCKSAVQPFIDNAQYKCDILFPLTNKLSLAKILGL